MTTSLINLCDIFNSASAFVKAPPYNPAGYPPYVTNVTGDANSGTITFTLDSYNAVFDYKPINNVYYFKIDPSTELLAQLFISKYLNTSINNPSHMVDPNARTITIAQDNYVVKTTLAYTPGTPVWYTGISCQDVSAAAIPQATRQETTDRYLMAPAAVAPSAAVVPQPSANSQLADSWVIYVGKTGPYIRDPSADPFKTPIGTANIIRQGGRFWD